MTLRTVLHGSRDYVTRELLAVDSYMQAHPFDPTQAPDSPWDDVMAGALAIATLLVIVALSSVVPS